MRGASVERGCARLRMNERRRVKETDTEREIEERRGERGWERREREREEREKKNVRERRERTVFLSTFLFHCVCEGSPLRLACFLLFCY